MNRFTYRGKADGNWVYGSYFRYIPYTPYPTENPTKEDYKHIIIKESFSDWGMPRSLQGVDIDPNTVGQCTGLKDCKGNYIFEGDYVIESFGHTGTYRVDFFEHDCKFYYTNLNDEDYNWEMLSTADQDGLDVHEGVSTDLQIVGNKYDNPEIEEHYFEWLEKLDGQTE